MRRPAGEWREPLWASTRILIRMNRSKPGKQTNQELKMRDRDGFAPPHPGFDELGLRRLCYLLMIDFGVQVKPAKSPPRGAPARWPVRGRPRAGPRAPRGRAR